MSNFLERIEIVHNDLYELWSDLSRAIDEEVLPNNFEIRNVSSLLSLSNNACEEAKSWFKDWVDEQ